MRKNVLIAASLLFFISGVTAFAVASTRFTDEAQFADWYKSSAYVVNSWGVMNGYADGRFGPDDAVTRAQMAVMLNKYDQHVSQNQISADELQDILSELLNYQDSNISSAFKVPVIMAEAGLKQMSGPPAGIGSEIKIMEDDRGEPLNLPKGYTLYERPSYVYSYYLHYVGPRAEGDVVMDRDQWYGPF